MSTMSMDRRGGRALALLLLAVAGPLVARAQVGIDVTLDRTTYCLYEPVMATVTLTNFTGNGLVFGDREPERGELTFRLQTGDGKRLLPDTDAGNPAGGLVLGAGETKSVKVLLNNVFDLQAEGDYTVAAQVGHSRLSQDFRSTAVLFTISQGRVVWTRRFGLPGSPEGKPITSRKASLYLFPDRQRDQYALFLEDDQAVYGVVRLGPRISGSAPQCDVDALSHIHVLFMSRPRLVEYRIYDYGLRLRQHRYYIADQSVPMLQRDPEIGRIMVVGGRPAVEGIDYTVDMLRDENAGAAPEPEPAADGGTDVGKKPAGDDAVKPVTLPESGPVPEPAPEAPPPATP